VHESALLLTAEVFANDTAATHVFGALYDNRFVVRKCECFVALLTVLQRVMPMMSADGLHRLQQLQRDEDNNLPDVTLPVLVWHGAINVSFQVCDMFDVVLCRSTIFHLVPYND
jgi:hypothetical protein